MKPEITITERPAILLQGFSLILFLVFLLTYAIGMHYPQSDIPYAYLGTVFLIIFLIARFSPKKHLKITESGFEYKKGKVSRRARSGRYVLFSWY